jgi:hypothetical protein
MGSQQRSPQMPNEEITRGSAVSDGVEEQPSERAELLIILRDAAGRGEPFIWHGTDDGPDKLLWLVAMLRRGLR